MLKKVKEKYFLLKCVKKKFVLLKKVKEKKILLKKVKEKKNLLKKVTEKKFLWIFSVKKSPKNRQKSVEKNILGVFFFWFSSYF